MGIPYQDLIEAAIDQAFKEWDASESQRADAKLVLLPEMEFRNGMCVLKETGRAIDDPTVRALLQERKPHLFPAKFERSLADRAFIDGNLNARGALLREVGEVEATKIAQAYGLRSLHDTRRGTRPANVVDGSEKKSGTADHRDNPWSAIGWNITRQGALVRSLGVEKASALARAVNSHVGATRPSM